MDKLLHIRVSKKLLDKLQLLIDDGLYNNQAEIVREGLRNLLLKYREELKENKEEDERDKH
jgi:Arc/MetJ-type ribon-helix-helix transcriptional regulator